MHSRENGGRPLRLDRDASALQDAERPTQENLGGGGAEADDNFRLHERDLVLKPREASANLTGVGRLVNAPLSRCVLCPLEMLHRIGDVHIVAIDAGAIERAIEKLARRTDERFSRAVLHVPRLLANDHDVRRARTFTEHGLRADLEQVTTATPFRGGTQLR